MGAYFVWLAVIVGGLIVLGCLAALGISLYDGRRERIDGEKKLREQQERLAAKELEDERKRQAEQEAEQAEREAVAKMNPTQLAEREVVQLASEMESRKLGIDVLIEELLEQCKADKVNWWDVVGDDRDLKRQINRYLQRNALAVRRRLQKANEELQAVKAQREKVARDAGVSLKR